MDNQQQNDKQPAQMGKNSSTNANVKSITNIYYDCLERIFDFLDLESLLNVANTCKRLQTAAAVKFGDVYGQNFCFLILNDQPRIHINNGVIYVSGVKFCLPFSRCFGAKLSGLTIFYNNRVARRVHGDNDYVDQYINQYINQYCAKTLKTISFRSASRFLIGNLPHPFECVEEVNIDYVNLAAQLPHFVHVFPNLRALKLGEVTFDKNRNHANVQFPRLEKLCIRCRITMQDLMDLLQANPQLQELDLRTGMSSDLTMPELLNMISGNPSIKRLIIWKISGGSINQADLMQFASEHPNTVDLDVYSSLIKPQDAIIVIRQLKSLKLFRFSVNDQTDYDQLVSQLDSEWKHKHTTLPPNNHYIELMR